MNPFRWLWLRLTCRHQWVWQRNYYGDLIHLSGGKRSLWICSNCGKTHEREITGPL